MKLSHIALGTSLAVTPATMLVAQTAKQDMQRAGSHTKSAVQDAGKGISKGTKKTYHKTQRGTKKTYTETTNKVDGNPSTH